MVVLQEGQKTLKVVAEKDGVTVKDSITQVYQTATWGNPATVRLETLETNADTVTLQATLLDAHGVHCLDAADYIYFSAIGDGELLADLGTSDGSRTRSEEHTSELQSLMRISYAVFCLKKKKSHNQITTITQLQSTTTKQRI